MPHEADQIALLLLECERAGALPWTSAFPRQFNVPLLWRPSQIDDLRCPLLIAEATRQREEAAERRCPHIEPSGLLSRSWGEKCSHTFAGFAAVRRALRPAACRAPRAVHRASCAARRVPCAACHALRARKRLPIR